MYSLGHDSSSKQMKLCYGLCSDRRPRDSEKDPKTQLRGNASCPLRSECLPKCRAKVAGYGVYLEVHGTYNLLSNCSYNIIISPITTITLYIIGL